MTKNDLVTIRDFRPEDKNFILSTFLRGLYHGGSCFSIMNKQTFMEHYHGVAESLLASPNTKVKVACLKEDLDVILGYTMLSGETAIIYTFIKKSWRGIGLAKDLIPPTATTYTHYTKIGLAIAKEKGLQFNPFVF